MRFISQVSSAALLAAAAAGTASAGKVLWDGRFNDYASASDLDKWSFSNPVGSYQYYIHGDGPAAEYVELAGDFKNPADAASRQGVRISLTDTAFWNGQNMRRTELIPETKAAINKGKVYYHFSMKRGAARAPAAAREHQIAFFESHFTEMKAGGADPALQWFADGTSQWQAAWEPEVWHNVAYEIDFDAGTVGFWHSTGADALKQVVEPVKAGTSSNGADWHLGMLELPKDGAQDADEDIFFSGVYIESGDLTTEIGSGGSGGGGGAAAAPAASKPASTTTTAAATATAAPTSTLVTSAKASTTAAASSAAPSSAAAAATTSTTAAAQTSAAPKPKCRKRKARRSL